MFGLFKRILISLGLILWFSLPAYAKVGLINSEGDGNPADVFAYKIVWPNGTISIDANGVLTYTPAAGSGDVISVGDCASGACLDGTSDGGTYIRLYDGDSNYGQISVPNLSSDVVYTMPDSNGTILDDNDIGVTVQAYDADIPNVTAFAGTLLDDANATAAQTTLGLLIGTNVQAYDADLTTWADVTPGTGIATALAVNVGSAGAPVLFDGAGGTPSAITLTNGTGLPIASGVSGLGTGVATALAVNVGSAGAPVLFNGAGGTPSSLTLTNGTGLPLNGLTAAGGAATINSGTYDHLITLGLNGEWRFQTAAGHYISIGNIPETGTHTGAGDAATLTDSAASFVVDELIGTIIYNTTDGSSCTITDNDATTVTCTLSGGTDNDWDNGDAYSVSRMYLSLAGFSRVSLGTFTVSTDSTHARTGTSVDDDLYMDAYDTDTGPAYIHMITLKAGTEPYLYLGPQANGLRVDQTGVLTHIGSSYWTNIELGAADDTTITRSGAGVMAVEGVPVLTVSGGTLTDTLITDASDATASGLRLPHGAAPSAPTNGDLWTTTGGLYARINGVTVGPFVEAAGSTNYDSIGDPTGVGLITFDDGETATYDGAWDTETAITISLNAANLTGDTTGLLITAVDNDDANYIPLLIQDDQDGTPDDLFKVDYLGTVTLAGDLYINGDDLFMATNTDGYMLIADGTNYNPVAISGDIAITNAGVTTIQANAVDSSMINTVVDSAYWDAGGMTPDGTQCADAARVTINSGPVQYTVICADNDASTLYGHIVMPDSWDGGTVTFEHEYLQTAADTAVLNGDIACQCRGAAETPSSTWGTEVAIDDAAVTGSNAVDHTTSAAVTCAGTCAGGDSLWWRYQVDATGTTTAVATLHNLGMKMEYTSNVGD